MPTAHLSDGLALAQQILPRSASGQPNLAGKIVLLSIGMSNTSQEYTTFIMTATNDSSLNPALVLVNGAQGGMTAAAIQNPNDGGSGSTFWQTVDTRLNNASVTREQVQVVWLKEADASPSGSDISYAQTLASELQTILRVLHDRFPNLKLTYLSSRSYAGYASITLNPEPYAYASGFSVKWTIERQLSGAPDLNYDPAQGAVVAPWIAWGPYFWADGTNPRSDGLTWLCSDFNQYEGTHPSSAGAAKIANMLLTFFKTDPTSQPWFIGSSDIYLPLISKQ
jgi:hypothetical protein